MEWNFWYVTHYISTWEKWVKWMSLWMDEFSKVSMWLQICSIIVREAVRKCILFHHSRGGYSEQHFFPPYLGEVSWGGCLEKRYDPPQSTRLHGIALCSTIAGEVDPRSVMFYLFEEAAWKSDDCVQYLFYVFDLLSFIFKF